MPTLTFFRRHNLDISGWLEKSRLIAGVACRDHVKWHTSNDAKQIGAPSRLSQTILNCYREFKNVKEVIRAPVVIPGSMIFYEGGHFRIPALNLALSNPCPYAFSKVHRITIDGEFYYISLKIDSPLWKEIDSRTDICDYDAAFKVEDCVLWFPTGGLTDTQFCPSMLKKHIAGGT